MSFMYKKFGTRLLYASLLALICASAHAAPQSVRERFKEIVAGEGNATNIEVEEFVVKYSNPAMEAETKKFLKQSGATDASTDSTPKFYRVAKWGDFYSLERRTAVGGDLILAHGRDDKEMWRYQPNKVAETLNASKGTSFAKGRLERVAHSEALPGERGRLLKIANGDAWAYRPLSASIKMGIPLAPRSGTWVGDTFSGSGLRPDLRYSGHVRFSEDGRPIFAEYTFRGANFEQRVRVDYLEYRSADGLPSKFSVSRTAVAGSVDTSEILYTIHSADYAEAPLDRFSSAIYGGEKDLVVAKYSGDKMTTVYKGRVQSDPEEVDFWKKRAWAGLAVLVVVTPIILFYAGPRLKRGSVRG
jgi:hypothetical protein